MAWPKLEKVDCIGFSRILLPYIKAALEAKSVEWIEDTCKLFMELGTGQFRWAGCVWELEEMAEWVTSIRLVSGHINNQDLTAAVLRG